MLPNVMRQLRRLADVSKATRRKQEAESFKPRMEQFDDRTMLDAVPAGHIVRIFEDVTYSSGSFGFAPIQTLAVGVVAINPADGSETPLYDFPDADNDGIADAFSDFASNPYSASQSGQAASVAVANGTLFVAVNRDAPGPVPIGGASSLSDLYQINPVTGAAKVLGSYDHATNELLASPDGTLLQIWDDSVTSPLSPYGNSIDGVSRINPADASVQVVQAPPSGTRLVDYALDSSGDFYTLTTVGTTNIYGSASSGITSADSYTVTEFSPTNQPTVHSTQTRRGDDLALGGDGNLYVAWTDGTFTNGPYGEAATAAIQGLSRINPASGTNQDLGTQVSNAEAQSRFAKVAVSANGTAFLAAQDLTSPTNPYDFTTAISQGQNNGNLLAIGTAPWEEVEDIVSNADGTLNVSWKTSTLRIITLDFGSGFTFDFKTLDTNRGVSRYEIATGTETVTFAVPSDPTTNPYQSVNPSFQTVPSQFVSDTAGNDYLGFNDSIDLQSNPYTARGLLINADAGTTISTYQQGTFDITIAPDLPTAVADAFTTEFLTPLTITALELTANDTTTNRSTFRTVSVATPPPPTAGTLVTNPDGSITFTPAADFFGDTTFTYTLSDGLATSLAATVTITVNLPPVPTANPDAFTTDFATPVTIAPAQLTANDTSAIVGPLTVAIVTPPPASAGTFVTNPDGSFTFTPATSFSGDTTFTYTVSNVAGASLPATVTITVNPPPTPIANPDAFSTNFATPVTIAPAQLTANDTSPSTGPLTVAIVAPPPASAGTFVTNPDGSFTFTPATTFSGNTTFTYTVSNVAGPSLPATVTITVNPVDPGKLFAASVGAGALPVVRFYTADGRFSREIMAFEPAFDGGVRVATGDINGDGFDDVAAGAGPGGGPRVVVYDGKTGALLESFFAFEESFSNGVFVALGDVNGDGLADLVIGAGSLGGPRVQVRDGADLTQILADDFAYDPDFRGGVRVAVGDLDGDGVAEIVTGAGLSGSPHVRTFNVVDGSATLVEHGSGFFAFDPAYRGGIFVAVANDSSGRATIVVTPDSTPDISGTVLSTIFPTLANVNGAAAGRGAFAREFVTDPIVYTFSASGVPGPTFPAFETAFRTGVRVTGVDSIGGDATILVAPGSGNDGVIKRFRLPASGGVAPLDELSVFSDMDGLSIYVG